MKALVLLVVSLFIVGFAVGQNTKTIKPVKKVNKIVTPTTTQPAVTSKELEQKVGGQASESPVLVTDIDGNLYRQVKIGNQVFLADNLKVTHFKNGDPIPLITEKDLWNNSSQPGYCVLYNNQENIAEHGLLYNFYVVADPRGVCPDGWKVPSYSEWNTLPSYLESKGLNAGALKMTGFTYWAEPNEGATNSTGFNGKGSGSRASNFGGKNDSAIYWSSTEYDAVKGYGFGLHTTRTFLMPLTSLKIDGFSVRCMKE